jgi:hypothetical protein
MGDRGSIPGRGKRIFSSSPLSKPALRPNQPPAQWVQEGVLSPGDKAWSERDADHLTPSSTEIENEQELYRLFPKAPPWHVVGKL